MPRKNKQPSETARGIVEQAQKATGYRSHPNRESAFGRETGYPGAPWAGSYVHEVLRERGVLETAFISTSSALGWYVKNGRVRTEKPQIGDVVFYAFSSVDEFEQPHVGIVTDVSNFAETGEFEAVEGETASGTARGSQDKDGVFARKRFEPDVLGFVTPREPKPATVTGAPGEVPTLRPTNFGKRSPLRQTATEAVQFALFETTGVDKFSQGEWDGLTRAAFNKFLRQAGFYAEVGEVPTDIQLQLLENATYGRYFTVFRPEV